MMRNFKQVLAALLSCAMLFPLAACGNADGVQKSTDTTAAPSVAVTDAVTTEAVTTSIDETHLEPTDAYKGREFRVLERSLSNGRNLYYEAYSEGETGEVINDAIYRRNSMIEDKYGVKIVSTTMSQGDMFNAISNDVAAQDHNYEINMNNTSNTYKLALAGCLIDMNRLDYVDFSQDWWYTDTMEETKIAGKNAFAIGDITNQSYTSIVALFYNRTLGTQYGIEDPYQLVLDGKWTFEKMSSLGKEVSTDLDGDGWDNDDRYTLAAANWSWQPFFYGQGGSLVTRDANGNPTLTALNEEAISILEDIVDLVHDQSYCWYQTTYKKSAQGLTSTADTFEAGHALFWPQLIIGAVRQRNMEMDFGMLPLPKKDEMQTEYISYIYSHTSLLSVPITNTDLEFTGRIVEDMAIYSRRVVRPAFFEDLYDGVVTRDAQTSQMLEILWSNLFMDLVEPLNVIGLSLKKSLVTLMDENSKAFVSTFDKNRSADQAALDSLLEAYQKME